MNRSQTEADEVQSLRLPAWTQMRLTSELKDWELSKEHKHVCQSLIKTQFLSPGMESDVISSTSCQRRDFEL